AHYPTRRPRRATRLPYTTLFRSQQAQRTFSYILLVFNVSPALAPIVGGQLIAHLGWRSVFWMLAVLAALAACLCGLRLPETLPTDRKSTRLNSSHVKISYTVCCS